MTTKRAPRASNPPSAAGPTDFDLRGLSAELTERLAWPVYSQPRTYHLNWHPNAMGGPRYGWHSATHFDEVMRRDEEVLAVAIVDPFTNGDSAKRVNLHGWYPYGAPWDDKKAAKRVE